MKYFNSLPFLTTTDNNGNSIALRNLLIRTEMIPQLAKNPLVFYQYTLQEGDTPEIVANKYYGDPFRYWIVMYGNPNMLDAQSDWPLTTQQFLLYLNDKYMEVSNNNVLSYTQGTVHHYEKVVTTIDNTSQTTAIKTVEIDENTYNNLQTFTNTVGSVTYSVSGNAVSIYDYENQLNESKRNINLINNTYASAMETQYQLLVNS